MTLKNFDFSYNTRHRPESLQECLRLEGHVREPDVEWLWRGAMLHHYVGMRSEAEGDSVKALHSYSHGGELAARAEAMGAVRVEVLFWRAVCDLESARLRGKVAAGLAVGAAEKRLNRASGLDEGYHYGGPMRVLGRIYHHKPLLMGGSLDRALAFYDRALQLAPENSTNLIYRADALLADHQPAEARRTLHHILHLQIPDDWAWETQRDQELARVWLQSRLD